MKGIVKAPQVWGQGPSAFLGTLPQVSGRAGLLV